MARLKPIARSNRQRFTTPPLNRGLERKRTTDNVKNVEVTLMDHDAAIMYYFTNVIQPTVEEAGETVKVPVLYANPERWKTIVSKVVGNHSGPPRKDPVWDYLQHRKHLFQT